MPAGDTPVRVSQPQGPATGGREVRFFAAARDAAGTVGTTVTATTVAGLRSELSERFGPELGRVLGMCSLLVDGHTLPVDAGSERELPGDGVVDVLPPFAGG